MTRVVLATCNRWPEVSASDRLYASALARRGPDVRAAPWNGDPGPLLAADAVILRSNWDYHEDVDGFAAWIDNLQYPGKVMLNPPAMVLWNLDERYLIDLSW